VKQRELPADGATREQFDEINRERKTIRDARRARFSDVRAPIINTISRDGDVSAQVRETGRIINEQLAEESEREETVAKRVRGIERLARDRGIDPATIATEEDVERIERALRLRAKAEAAIAQMEGGH
jgi:hypothetical protein